MIAFYTHDRLICSSICQQKLTIEPTLGTLMNKYRDYLFSNLSYIKFTKQPLSNFEVEIDDKPKRQKSKMELLINNCVMSI